MHGGRTKSWICEDKWIKMGVFQMRQTVKVTESVLRPVFSVCIQWKYGTWTCAETLHGVTTLLNFSCRGCSTTSTTQGRYATSTTTTTSTTSQKVAVCSTTCTIPVNWSWDCFLWCLQVHPGPWSYCPGETATYWQLCSLQGEVRGLGKTHMQ